MQTLLRYNVDIPYSCGVGVCQSCLLKSASRDIPESAQVGLKKSLIKQNYFLPCVCKPKRDFEIIQSDKNDIFVSSQVIGKQWLSSDVCQIILKKPASLQFHPGQSINIRNTELLTRSYSIASTLKTGVIEIHVKYLQNGQMSHWLCKELKTGDSVYLQGANGESYYENNTKNNNILLIGTGTGLAPLLGIVRNAFENKHQGEIHMYHGSRYSSGLYLVDSLRQLEKQHSNFWYTPCISSSNNLLNNKVKILDSINKRADKYALENHSALQNWNVYLSGHPQMVNKVKAQAYIAGAQLCDIHIAPFELKDLRKTIR